MTAPLRFAVQKHAARRLHFDLRPELGGVLKSWAVPKGPSLDPRDRRLAVAVEDHRLDYAEFEGVIAEGGYGAGAVMLWDQGRWAPNGDAAAMLGAGDLRFRLDGERLRGGWRLRRLRRLRGAGERDWLLVKRRDAEARDEAVFSAEAEDRSVATGRNFEEIRASP